MNTQDIDFMQQALNLAKQGLGRTAPNPSVGCIVVKGGEVIGHARTADNGRPHAETQALAQAGAQAEGSTVYVTLEPCNTHGQTTPCVDALIAAKVSRVVVACCDPFQKDKGGLDHLRAAGIEVSTGVLEDKAKAINEGFFKVIKEGRPFVTAKIATTLDGKIATFTGESKWITGEAARQRVHEMRATHDAVLVGHGTVLADDPLLSVRLKDHDFQPIRIVIDRDLKIDVNAQLIKTAQESAVWVIAGEDADEDARKKLEDNGIKVIPVTGEDFLLNVSDILNALAREGITRLFVEGGSFTITEFIKSGLVDEFAWFRAPKLIGGDGLPAIHQLGISQMSNTVNFKRISFEMIGEDSLEILKAC